MGRMMMSVILRAEGPLQITAVQQAGGGGAVMLLRGNKGHSDNSLTVGVSDTLVVVDFTDISAKQKTS